MTVEADIFTALKSLVSNHVYRGVAPQGVTALPRITFQQVGGTSVNYLSGADPDFGIPRIQTNVWHSTYDQAKALAKQVATAMRASTTLQATLLGEPLMVYESDTELHGAIQDFSVADHS